MIRENQLGGNGYNGMVVRGGTLTTESVWDDTDMVHIVMDGIFVPNQHSFGGLRLKSSTAESLVVKFFDDDAGFVTTGSARAIPDHIGGAIRWSGSRDGPWC